MLLLLVIYINFMVVFRLKMLFFLKNPPKTALAEQMFHVEQAPQKSA